MRLDRFQSIDPALLEVGLRDRVIDLGCGTGRHVLELAKGRGDIIGADISRHDLRIARFLLEIMRRRGEVQARVHWLQMAGEQLPFAGAAFDRVICTETLEHVDDDRVLARELARVLKPGGILAVSVPDEYSEKLFWKLSPNYRTHVGGHVRVYERRAIVELLRSAGLRPYAVRYRHAMETFYWLSHIAFWSDWGEQGPITGAFRRLLDSERAKKSRLVWLLDGIGNRVLPKSIVVYSRKPLTANGADLNGLPPAALTNNADEPAAFGIAEHATVEAERGLAPSTVSYRDGPPDDEGVDDERRELQVRAVPAPFEVSPALPTGRGGSLSLSEELWAAVGLPPDEQKRRLIELLRSCRYGFMREVQDIDGERASAPWTPDGRSLKEIVGHITAWEQWTISALGEIADGRLEPSIMSLSGFPGSVTRYASIDEFNAARMGESRGAPWNELLERSNTTFETLLIAIEQAPSRALRRTAPFFWPDLGGTLPCGLYLLMVAAYHYEEEHRPEVNG